MCPACCLAPSQRSSPQAISTVSCPSSMLSRSLPAKLSPTYLHGFLSVQHAVSLSPSEAFRKLFTRFPFHSACCLAPSQRSSPQAIRRFPIRPACCLAPSQRSSPQAICTVSCPSSMLSRFLPAKVSSSSSMLSRSLPAKLSASYFHGFLSVQHAVSLPPSEAFRKLFARFPVRPACSLPAKLSASYYHGFLSVQHAVSLPPSEVHHKLFARFPKSVQHAVSLPPSEAFRNLFTRFPHAVSLSPSQAFRKLFTRFPLHSACCLAPSQRSFPQAICTVSSPSSMLSRSLPAKLSPSYLHSFQSVQHAVSLPPSKAFRKLFARFSLRPACWFAASQRSSPQATSRVSCPSSMLSRFFPGKLSPSYGHGFLSVQHAVSLLPSEAHPKLFARFPVSSMLSRSLPAKLSTSYLHGFQSVQRCLAPSQRSFPQAICTVSSPSSMLSRFSAKLSASYLHGFLSVQHAVSLPPSEALPKLFARFPIRPACCLAPSQRSFPQAICTVSSPSSMLSRSLPAKLSPIKLLFPPFPVRPACCLAPSQRSFPQAICMVSEVRPACCLAPSQRSFRQLSYFHRFLSVQHAVLLPPSEAFRKLFARFPIRPACCLAPSGALPKLFARFPIRPACCLTPSQRSSPQAICTSPSFLPSFPR